MSTAVATAAKPQGQLTLRDHLSSPAFLAEVAKVLPSHVKPERMIRVAITAIMKTPKLAQCTQASFFNCMLNLSQWGLEPDGRRAHLIPFENKKKKVIECQLIVDYKGLSELVYRSGVVSYLHADVVRRGDIFIFSKGEVRDHIPWYLRTDDAKPEAPGDIYAAYALARMKDGGEKADVLSLSEIHSIRDNSQGWRAFKNGYTSQCPWDPSNAVSEQEMMKKTAFRRLSKWLPLSAEIVDAMDRDDGDQSIDVTSRPIGAAPALTLDQLAAEIDAPEQDPPETEREPGGLGI